MKFPFRSHLINLAREDGEHPRCWHAALLAQGKRILGESTNYAFMHAETNAIRVAEGAGHDLKGTTLYTLMLRARSGRIGNGTPCAECMREIKRAGIKRVIVYI